MFHGADPYQSNSRGKTPLDVSASSIITKLLKKEEVTLLDEQPDLTDNNSTTNKSESK